MKKIAKIALLVALSACVLSICAGCGKKTDPVKEDLYQYLSQMTSVQGIQVRAITQYNEAVASSDSRVLYDQLNETILPAYDDYLAKLDLVKTNTDEVAAIKQSCVDASLKQKDALEKISAAIDAVDKQQLTEADQLVTESQNMFNDYYDQLKKLADDHGITMTKASGEGVPAADSTAE